uniref:Pentatricopeptide repeat-containing protein n=1 Tax=Ananas comosus var. bracteatus TaxID=296719 RepID=A0A6V7Q280_ANACO|nr:unnamed protein product [Ananas comosus var. bracteatus]
MITKFKNHPWLYFSTTSCHPLPPSLFPHFQIQQQVNDLLSSLCKQKRFHEALRAFNSLQTQGSTFRLLPSTYAHLFFACSHLNPFTMAALFTATSLPLVCVLILS